MTTPATAPVAATGRTVSAARFMAWAGSAAVIVLTLVPPDLRPVSEAPHVVEHLVPFLLLGGAFALGYPGRELLTAAIALPCIALLELLQVFDPGRHARLSDFAVNAIGACAGAALVAVASRMRMRGRAPLG